MFVRNGSLHVGGCNLPGHVELLTVARDPPVIPAEEREVSTCASVVCFCLLSLIGSVTSASISVPKKMGKLMDSHLSISPHTEGEGGAGRICARGNSEVGKEADAGQRPGKTSL